MARKGGMAEFKGEAKKRGKESERFVEKQFSDLAKTKKKINKM